MMETTIEWPGRGDLRWRPVSGVWTAKGGWRAADRALAERAAAVLRRATEEELPVSLEDLFAFLRPHFRDCMFSQTFDQLEIIQRGTEASVRFAAVRRPAKPQPSAALHA